MANINQKNINQKKVAVVILNWNGASFLQKYLPSVVAFSTYDWSEIVVADNGSTDNSREVIEQQFPSVRFLPLTENYGFAKGYNMALQNIDAEYFLLLNSDVAVTRDWLLPLTDIMELHPDVAACQPKILSDHNRTAFEYAGASGGYIDRYGYPFCRGRILNVCETDHGQYNLPVSVFWATGAALLVRASHWNEVGGFDPDFWAHMEEIDLCWRFKNRGYKVYVNPESTVYHLGGGTLPYSSPAKTYLNFRNNLFLLYKNLPKKGFTSTLLQRMILDGIAALQFLVTGQWQLSYKVLLAHIHFYKHLSGLRKKRARLNLKRRLNNHPEIYGGSLIWQFFIRRKRHFSELFTLNNLS